MRFSLQEAGSRRDFLRAAGRYSLLSVLLGALAVAARGRRNPGGQCVNQGICGGCPAFQGCQLPPALSAKATRVPKV